MINPPMSNYADEVTEEILKERASFAMFNKRAKAKRLMSRVDMRLEDREKLIGRILESQNKERLITLISPFLPKNEDGTVNYKVFNKEDLTYWNIIIK